MHSLTDLCKSGPPIERGRISRREALAAGVGTLGLTMLPELRGETAPLTDNALRYKPDYLATAALACVEENVPKLDRNYAGYGNDGEPVILGDEEYELQLLYSAAAIHDGEFDDLTTEKLVVNYLHPMSLALARCFDQPGLKHLVTRRIEPIPAGTGKLSHFAFHDFMGLRATIGYEAGPVPARGQLGARVEGRTTYVLDMLIGVRKEYARSLLPCPVRMPSKTTRKT
jgi:hypothetical protein